MLGLDGADMEGQRHTYLEEGCWFGYGRISGTYWGYEKTTILGCFLQYLLHDVITIPDRS